VDKILAKPQTRKAWSESNEGVVPKNVGLSFSFVASEAGEREDVFQSDGGEARPAGQEGFAAFSSFFFLPPLLLGSLSVAGELGFESCRFLPP
jgi:hypothetical protein